MTKEKSTNFKNKNKKRSPQNFRGKKREVHQKVRNLFLVVLNLEITAHNSTTYHYIPPHTTVPHTPAQTHTATKIKGLHIETNTHSTHTNERKVIYVKIQLKMVRFILLCVWWMKCKVWLLFFFVCSQNRDFPLFQKR